jgi:hypothetical protein
MKFLEYARTFPFVKEGVSGRIPGAPITRAELIDELNRVEAEHNPAAAISHADVVGDLEKRIAGWR